MNLRSEPPKDSAFHTSHSAFPGFRIPHSALRTQ